MNKLKRNILIGEATLWQATLRPLAEFLFSIEVE